MSHSYRSQISSTSSASGSGQRVQTTRTVTKTLPDGRVSTETFTDYQVLQNGGDVRNTKPLTHSVKLVHERPQPVLEIQKSEAFSESSSDEEEIEEDFAKEALKAHNDYRKRHGVKPLRINEKLCQYAADWAQKLADEDRFDHRPNSKFGENLYMAYNSNPNAKIPGSSPVDNWYSEAEDHPFGAEPRSMSTGHFTQVVWKGSKELGIAMARSRSGKVIVVANYQPAGNYIGSYADNVPAPRE